MGKKIDFFNKKVGGFGLGLIIMAAYISAKFTLGEFSLDADFYWYSTWFTVIIVSALTADLFQNNKTWIYNAMENVSREDINSDEKLIIIKNQLSIAVDRYQTVFIKVNGFDTQWKLILANITKIWKGAITVKELIIIMCYALWDLVVRSGAMDLEAPYDVLILFLGLVGLKIVDAKSGFAELVAEMYKEAQVEKTADVTLSIIAGYIKELCNQYDIEYTIRSIPADDQVSYYFDKIAAIHPEKEAIIKEIQAKLLLQ